MSDLLHCKIDSITYIRPSNFAACNWILTFAMQYVKVNNEINQNSKISLPKYRSRLDNKMVVCCYHRLLDPKSRSGGMVDAAVSKTVGAQSPCQFESGLRHQLFSRWQ